MNTTEYLLVCAAEEACEIADAAQELTSSKNFYAGQYAKLCNNLVHEVHDLIAVTDCIREAGVELPGLFEAMIVDSEGPALISAVALRAAKAVHKALRFGIDDGYPGTGRTNRADFVKEVNLLIALMQRADFLTGAGFVLDPSAIDAKKAKMLKWMGYAETNGTLQR